jgi:hypothetical protein
MAPSGNRFATALRHHDRARLRQAFDACREAGVGSYDRTTLNRWIDGSMPTSGDFIRCMADQLEDPGLYEAWQDSRQAGPRAAASPQAVVKRFESLSIEERKQAFPEIRKLFLEQFEEIRRRASWRVELRDAADPDADHFELRILHEYDGRLPADAWIVYTTDSGVLGDAYEEPDCVFREVLSFGSDTFRSLLETWPEQVLAYNRIGQANQQLMTHVGVPDGDGVFRFDNEEVEDARVRLSLAYPYPKGVGAFFLRLGQYRFEGGPEVTLALNTESASSPNAFPFLPAGRQREYAADLVRAKELAVTLGGGGTVLSEGDGVVLYWTET